MSAILWRPVAKRPGSETSRWRTSKAAKRPVTHDPNRATIYFYQ